MAIYQDVLISELKKICKKGQTIENFINNWIRSGESFSTLYQFLVTKGIETNRNSVWRTFRPMLTLPYSYKDQFLYKWNSIAKTKGFVTSKQMILAWKKQKYNLTQIADELGLMVCNTKRIIDIILNEGESLKDRGNLKHPKNRNDDSFSRKDFAKSWDERLKELGYENLQQAIKKMKKEGLNFSEMSKRLGISPRAFRWRRKRIKDQEEYYNEMYNLSRGKRDKVSPIHNNIP